MELLAFAAIAFVMIVVVFGAAVTIEILFNRRFGVLNGPRHDEKAQAHQQGVRSQLGAFGPGGGTQN